VSNFEQTAIGLVGNFPWVDDSVPKGREHTPTIPAVAQTVFDEGDFNAKNGFYEHSTYVHG
jgi:hypothetical protein